MENSSPENPVIPPQEQENKNEVVAKPGDSVRLGEPSNNSLTPADGSSNPPEPANDPTPRISLEELDERALRAKLNNYIAVDALIRIMAQEEDYTEEVYSRALPVL
jgi:hypothetical protein